MRAPSPRRAMTSLPCPAQIHRCSASACPSCSGQRRPTAPYAAPPLGRGTPRLSHPTCTAPTATRSQACDGATTPWAISRGQASFSCPQGRPAHTCCLAAASGRASLHFIGRRAGLRISALCCWAGAALAACSGGAAGAEWVARPNRLARGWLSTRSCRQGATPPRSCRRRTAAMWRTAGRLGTTGATRIPRMTENLALHSIGARSASGVLARGEARVECVSQLHTRHRSAAGICPHVSESPPRAIDDFHDCALA
jgi:hypothetical protein